MTTASPGWLEEALFARLSARLARRSARARFRAAFSAFSWDADDEGLFLLLGVSLVVVPGAEVEVRGARTLVVEEIGGASSSLSRISMISGIGLIG